MLMTRPIEVIGASIAVLTRPQNGRNGYQGIAIQRDDVPGVSYRGMWEFPGGTCDPGEDAETCAIRELYEETGVVLAPELIVWEAYYPSRQKPGFFNAFFAAEMPNGVMPEVHKGDEGRAARWVTMGQFTGRMPGLVGVIPDHIDRYYDFIHGANTMGSFATRRYVDRMHGVDLVA